GKSPGEWRTLGLAVKRPGLTVRARRGYRLQPTPDGARSMPATSRDPIPLRLASYILEPVDEAKTRVTVALEIDVNGLPSPEGGGDAQLVLRLEAIPRDGGETYRHDVTLQRSVANDDTPHSGG